VLAAITIVPSAAQQPPLPGQEPLVRRIVAMSEAEQIAFTNVTLDEGMQVNGEALAMLILNRSSLVLPMMEKKIEEVLRSQSPLDLFTSKTVDPQGFVNLAAVDIACAGDEQALKEVSKLIAIDEKRFGLLVRNTLSAALNLRNPITVAYHGFEIGDPAVDKRIAAWVESQFDIDSWGGQRDIRRWWVDAMLEKYGGVPNAVP
jgi:hypothetical protein